jgi:alpha-galactosidase
MMLCSGGAGRTDYTLFKYFTEFWLSDNTDPLERVLFNGIFLTIIQLLQCVIT